MTMNPIHGDPAYCLPPPPGPQRPTHCQNEIRELSEENDKLKSEIKELTRLNRRLYDEIDALKRLIFES